MKEIADLLLISDIKPSYPRVQVYNYLKNFRGHPTVEDIYEHIINVIPTLSKTTVYNTLSLFEDKGLVKSLNLDNKEKHYELIINNHSHFHCENCGGIFDIPYEDIDFLPKGYEDYLIKEKHILLKGLCPTCKDEK